MGQQYNGDYSRIDTEGKAGLLVQIGSGINDLTHNLAGLVSQAKAAAAEVNRDLGELDAARLLRSIEQFVVSHGVPFTPIHHRAAFTAQSM